MVASWPDVAGLRWLCNMVPTQRVSGCGVHIKSFQNLFWGLHPLPACQVAPCRA